MKSVELQNALEAFYLKNVNSHPQLLDIPF